MKNIIVILTISLVTSCNYNEKPNLYNEVNLLSKFEGIKKPNLIQSGIEEGFLEPMMEYEIYSIDSLSFNELSNQIKRNKKFKNGTYYLNIELDDYLLNNKLTIASIYSITKNKYDKIYDVYLLSDRNRFVICKVNQ